MSDESVRKVHKPNLVVEDEYMGLLETDETMTNQEFSSIFYNTAVFDENDGTMVFDAEVINKFKRVLLYQEKLEPLRERIICLQFEKYFEDEDVDRENSKVAIISLFGECEIPNVTIYASKENGDYIYVTCKTFRKMLKKLEDNTIQFLKPPGNEPVISLRLWAFDNDMDLSFENEKLEISFHDSESDESREENSENTEKGSSKKKGTSGKDAIDKAIDKALGSKSDSKKSSGNDKSQTKHAGTLTKGEYDQIFINNYVESGEDIEIKPSVLEKAEKLISNMEQVKAVRERFSYHNVRKFIEEDLNIDNLISDELKVMVNDRPVCKFKVYKTKEAEPKLYTNLFSFKILLTRAGSYYSLYLCGDKETFVNLNKWADESCAEIQIDKKSKTMKIIF